MGIRHLYTFICKNVDNGMFPVNMYNEVELYKRNHRGQTPTIVIDLFMIHTHVYTNNHEMLLGGRHEIYNERARNMFSRLKAMGVHLVFFLDGPMQPDKVETCLKRRNVAYENGIKLLHAIDEGLDLSGDLSNFTLVNLSTFFQNLIDIAQDYGEVHLSILNECDQEIVYLANTVGALAIITDDTDFLIFEGNWLLWSGKNIDFQRLTTLEYNKRALRETLSLSPRQMALFACLGGNDIVNYEMVEDFHRRISSRGNKFRQIADIIRKMSSLPPRLNYLDRNTLSNSIFHPLHRKQGMEALQNSMNFYCLVDMKFRHPNELLEHVSRDVKRFNYTILGNKEYIFQFIYSDLQKKFFTPYFDLTKPLICRTMGVLLQHETIQDVSRTFYFKLDHNRSFEPVRLTPQYPSYRVPQIMDLLYLPYGQNLALDQVRWALLWFIISPRLNSPLSYQIPRENLGNVLTIFYLMERKEITLDEADCLLLACNTPPEIQNSLDFNEVRRINGRDARLAFLYTRLYNVIYNCITAVGLRDYCALLRFDGLYFHTLRKRWSSTSEDLKRTILEPVKFLRIYSKDFGLL